MRRVGGVLIALVAACALLPGALRATDPLLFPAPAGSVWQIVAGYNTATHVGTDPYALDLVRTDAETTDTPVLAPVSGVLGYVSGHCLTIDDGSGHEILLCHLFPTPGLQRGMAVSQGQVIGAMAPAGAAENGGLPHLHLAIHRTVGAGLIQETVPFTGVYTLERQELPVSAETNAYAGLTIVSTNTGSGATTPTVATPQPQPEPEPPPPVLRHLQVGWNLVGWGGSASIEALLAGHEDQIQALLVFDAASQAFRRYLPGLAAASNLTTVSAQQAIMVAATAAFDWELPPVEPSGSGIVLRPGFNLVTWPGEAIGIADAVAVLGDALGSAFSFDAAAQRFRSYRPGVPAGVNTLSTLQPGQGLWLYMERGVVWDTGQPGSATPTDAGEGDTAFVQGPGCLNLRSSASTQLPPLTCLAEGTVVTLLGGTATGLDGYHWVQVVANGLHGWVASEFLSFS